MEQTLKPDVVYTDLLYFGYDAGDEEGAANQEFQRQFITEVTAKFPGIQLRDAYDAIKGFRQEVYLSVDEKDNYYSWLIAQQWYEFSLTMQLYMMSSKSRPENRAIVDKYLALAKAQYPEVFKA